MGLIKTKHAAYKVWLSATAELNSGRIGEAFLRHFYPGHSDPELFNCKSDAISISNIEHNYIDWEP